MKESHQVEKMIGLYGAVSPELYCFNSFFFSSLSRSFMADKIPSGGFLYYQKTDIVEGKYLKIVGV